MTRLGSVRAGIFVLLGPLVLAGPSDALPIPGKPLPPQYIFAGTICGTPRNAETTAWQRQLAAKRKRALLVPSDAAP